MMNLNEFKQALYDAGIVDMNPNNDGAVIWLPNGMVMRNLFIDIVRKVCEKYSFEEYLFPIMVPEKEFEKMVDNIYDFSKGIYHVDEEKILRPSGESIIYPQFKRWITSYNDLPIKVFQIGSAYRKLSSRSVFRLKEQDLFIEAHTAHSTLEEAEKQFYQNIELIKEVFDVIGLPAIYSFRPIWGNKPVSCKTAGIDSILPNGETILVGCAYLQNQIFSKPFNIQFTNKNNKKDYTYQTEFGLSAKPIFSSIFITSDSKGLNLLPEISPIQVIILPIIKNNNVEDLMAYVEEIKKSLVSCGIRCKIDYTKQSIGKKQYQYEKNGVPVRIVIGENEFKSRQSTVIVRETDEKFCIKFESIALNVKEILNLSSKLIRERIYLNHSNHIIDGTGNKNETNQTLSDKKILRYPLCFNLDCSGIAETNTKGEIIGYYKSDVECECVVCKKKTHYIAYHARRM